MTGFGAITFTGEDVLSFFLGRSNPLFISIAFFVYGLLAIWNAKRMIERAEIKEE
jgi:hypothetical protein